MTGTTTVPTDEAELRAHLLGQVDAIADTLASCADEAERAGRYPEAGWRALHDAGLFRMKAPRELGGAEADPVTQIELIEKVAYIDTTAAWTMFVGAGTLAIASAWLPEAAMDDYLVDGRLPRTAGGVAATGAAVPVEGGYRVTARWGSAAAATTPNGCRATRSSRRPTRRRCSASCSRCRPRPSMTRGTSAR
jgi:alkylation response protein AidB-like acyl-CoA dehydrogenase